MARLSKTKTDQYQRILKLFHEMIHAVAVNDSKEYDKIIIKLKDELK